MGFGAVLLVPSDANEQSECSFSPDAERHRVPRNVNEEFKSMDRHSRTFVGGCLMALMGMVMSAAGCRSMKNDVPPGKPYATTGGGAGPAVGFNSDPHPSTSVTGPGMYGNGLTPNAASADTGPVGAATGAQFGTPAPNASPYGMPPGNRYGAMPGTMTPPPLGQ
jgi:hypothetical protein